MKSAYIFKEEKNYIQHLITNLRCVVFLIYKLETGKCFRRSEYRVD